MNRLIAIFLIALCTVPSLQGQVDTSSRLNFYRTWLFQDWTNKSVFGVLYKVGDSSLLLANTADKHLLATGRFVISEVYSDQIHRIVLQQSGKRGLGTMIGLLAGFTTGLTVALVQNSKWKMSSENQELEDFNNGLRAFGIIAITVGFTGAGVGIGAMIDAIAKIKIKVAGDQSGFEANRARLEGYSLDYLYHGAIYPGGSFKMLKEMVSDRNGNVYHQLALAGQVWMAENLVVTHFRNGDPIAEAESASDWTAADSSAYCNNKGIGYQGRNYSRLYNRIAVNDPRGLCPEGWHVPEYDEWASLMNCLGGADNAGEILKVSGSETAFASMGGSRDNKGKFVPPGTSANYWWLKQDDNEIIVGLSIRKDRNDVSFIKKSDGENAGLSVKCIRDN